MLTVVPRSKIGLRPPAHKRSIRFAGIWRALNKKLLIEDYTLLSLLRDDESILGIFKRVLRTLTPGGFLNHGLNRLNRQIGFLQDFLRSHSFCSQSIELYLTGRELDFYLYLMEGTRFVLCKYPQTRDQKEARNPTLSIGNHQSNQGGALDWDSLLVNLKKLVNSMMERERDGVSKNCLTDVDS